MTVWISLSRPLPVRVSRTLGSPAPPRTRTSPGLIFAKASSVAWTSEGVALKGIGNVVAVDEPSSNCRVNEPPVVKEGRVTVCSSLVGPAACTSTTPIGSLRDNFAALIAINETLVDASACVNSTVHGPP